jgi:hypothetical protein
MRTTNRLKLKRQNLDVGLVEFRVHHGALRPIDQFCLAYFAVQILGDFVGSDLAGNLHRADFHEARRVRTEMSSSTSSQWIPMPRPMSRQLALCWGVARRSRGNHANGAETRRPSTRVTINSSSVHATSTASATGLLAKVLIPRNDKLLTVFRNDRVQFAEL